MSMCPACPACSKVLDAAASITTINVAPREGDVSICVHCCAWLRFDARLDLHALSAADREALPGDVRWLLVCAESEIRHHRTILQK